MHMIDGIPAIMTQEGVGLTPAAGSNIFSETISIGYDYTGEDTDGQTVERAYNLHLVIYADGTDGRVIGQYRTQERAVQVFQELRAAVISGQAYQMPPYEEEV